MKKKVLLTMLLSLMFILCLGTISYGRCGGCALSTTHASCYSKKYAWRNDQYHQKICCCGSPIVTSGWATSLELHSYYYVYVNSSSTCMKCSRCGLKVSHNTSGGHCSNAHCAYHSSKTLCSRGCKHYKWTSCRDHSYSSAWSRNDTHHWHRCKVTSSCSSKKSYGEHVDSNGDKLCDVCEKVSDDSIIEDPGGGRRRR